MQTFMALANQHIDLSPVAVIAWKAGYSQIGARAASSHTGSLAGNGEVVETALKQSGGILAHGLDEVIDLMTGFSLVPLQMFSLFGILISLLSLAFVVFLAVRRLVVGPEAEGLLAKRQLPLALSATAKAFDDYVQSESKRWEKIIRDNKVAIE